MFIFLSHYIIIIYYLFISQSVNTSLMGVYKNIFLNYTSLVFQKILMGAGT